MGKIGLLVQKKDRKVADLQKEKEETEAKLKEIAEKNQIIINDAKNKEDGLIRQNSSLHLELKKTKESYKGLQAQNDKLKEETQSLIRRMLTLIAECDQKYKALQHEYETSKKEWSAMKEKKDEQIAEYDKHSKALQVELLASQTESMSLKGQLKTVQSDLENLSPKHESLMSEFSQSQAENTTLKVEKTKILAEFEQKCQALESELLAVKDESNKLKADNTNLEKIFEEFKKQSIEISEKKENDNCKAKKSLEYILAKAESDLNYYKLAKAGIEQKLNEEIARASAAIEDLNKRHKEEMNNLAMDLEGKLAKSQADLDNEKAQNSTLSMANASLETQFETKDEETKNTNFLKSKLEREKQTLEKKFQKLEESNKTLLKDHETTKKQCEDLQVELEQLTNKLESKIRAQEETSKEIIKLKEDLNEKEGILRKGYFSDNNNNVATLNKLKKKKIWPRKLESSKQKVKN